MEEKITEKVQEQFQEKEKAFNDQIQMLMAAMTAYGVQLPPTTMRSPVRTGEPMSRVHDTEVGNEHTLEHLEED